MYMLRIFNLLFSFLLAFQLMNCKPAQSTLKAGMIANYDKALKEHILFLEFKISAEAAGKLEKVKLIHAVSGSGKMKDLNHPVQDLYRIMAVPRYKTSATEKEFYYEHPLFRSVEVANPAGTLSKKSISAKEGSLSIRIQENPDMDRIELFSITPEKGTVKIHTLYLQP